MLYFTGLQDTSESIAKAIMDVNPYESLADRIERANRNTLSRLMMNTFGGQYAPFMPVWVPGFSSLDSNPVACESIVDSLASLPSTSRMRIGLAMSRGTNFNHILSAAKVSHASNKKNESNSSLISTAIGGKVAIEGTTRLAEHTSHQAERFSEAINDLNQATKEAVEKYKVHGSSSTAYRDARELLKQQHKAALQALNTDAKLFTHRASIKGHNSLGSSRRILRKAKKHGILVNDYDDVKLINKVFRYGEWMSKGLLLTSVSLGADEVYQTYEEHGDVVAKAVGVGSELTYVYLAGGLLLDFTPGGWVVLGVAAVVEGVFLVATGNAVEHFMESTYKKGEEAWSWVKKHLKHWL